MASDALAQAPVQGHSRVLELAAEMGFIALLLLVFVGMDPFNPPPIVDQFGGSVIASAGDATRQMLYLCTFALILFCALGKYGLAALRALPLTLVALIGWCMASALWAAAPDVAVRRAGLEVVLVLSAMFSIYTIGEDRALVLWRWMMGAILIVNFLSIPLIPAAVHPFGELDTALVGNWRGLYGHKNIAGSVCAMTAMLFLFSFIERRRWRDILFAAAAFVFLVKTHSKSSLGLLIAAIGAGLVYRWGWRREMDRAIVLVGALLLAVVGGTLAAVNTDAIMKFLSDPTELTGRAAIWAAEVRYIADHPLLGAGFGTFADTGNRSPLYHYIGNDWVGVVSHGHSGYLQMLVTIGGIGFALGIAAFLLGPMTRFWRAGPPPMPMKSLLFALFVFFILHNVMETDFLEGDGVAWSGFLLMLGMLRTARYPAYAQLTPPA